MPDPQVVANRCFKYIPPRSPSPQNMRILYTSTDSPSLGLEGETRSPGSSQKRGNGRNQQLARMLKLHRAHERTKSILASETLKFRLSGYPAHASRPHKPICCRGLQGMLHCFHRRLSQGFTSISRTLGSMLRQPRQRFFVMLPVGPCMSPGFIMFCSKHT